MPVTVRLFASLREFKGEDRLQLAIREGETVRALLDRLFPSPPTQPWPPQLLFAVNHQWAEGDQILEDGDEVAFIPPLGGGSGDAESDPRASLSQTPLVLKKLIAQVSSPQRGGLVTFSGRVRDSFEGRAVQGLEYEAYAELALVEMLQICNAAETRWPGIAIAMSHRLGALDIEEDAVCIAVAAPHRVAAFEACRFAIDELKLRVPIFKKEVYADGSQWKANP